MNWEALGAIAETVGAVGVIATLVYLAVQVRQNTAAIRVQTYDSFLSQFRNWNETFRTNPALTGQWVKVLEDIESLNAEERKHAIHVLYDFFKLAEHLHYQYSEGMIIESLWSGWENNFRQYLNAPGCLWYWDRRRSFFAPEFATWVDELRGAAGDQPQRSAQLADD